MWWETMMFVYNLLWRFWSMEEKKVFKFNSDVMKYTKVCEWKWYRHRLDSRCENSFFLSNSYLLNTIWVSMVMKLKLNKLLCWLPDMFTFSSPAHPHTSTMQFQLVCRSIRSFFQVKTFVTFAIMLCLEHQD